MSLDHLFAEEQEIGLIYPIELFLVPRPSHSSQQKLTVHSQETPTGPSAADVSFYKKHGFYIFNSGSDCILRPEVLESNFYAFRATGDMKYLDRARQTLSAFNKVLSVRSGGFAGVNALMAKVVGLLMIHRVSSLRRL